MLSKYQLLLFLGKLAKTNELYAPVKHDEFYDFERITEKGQLTLNFTLSLYSLKQFVMPPEEPIMIFSRTNTKQIMDVQQKIIFGARPCDVNALKLSDEFMLAEPADPYYRASRAKLTIIAVACQQPQLDTCFCAVFQSYKLDSGFDIALDPKGDGYYVKSGSNKGRALLKTNRIKEDNLPAKQPNFKLNKKLAEFKERIANLDDYRKSKSWEKHAKSCFACGGCTLVCPTCMCFDIIDVSELDLCKGIRKRSWDSCQLKDFTRIAGNIRFRRRHSERMQHRYYHKLVWSNSCVGCGRCSIICPANVNMVELVIDL